MPGIISTVVIGALIALVVFLSVRKLWRDKKSGRSCCGGSCQRCAGCGMSQKKMEKKSDLP